VAEGYQAEEFMSKFKDVWDETVRVELVRLAKEMESIATDKNLILKKNQ
jgi:hypothetical protein